MFDLTSFTFATPWVLLGLAVLPLLWFLLRVSPPAPKRQIFPAVRILSTLIPEEETPARTPWWLLLLRLLAAALIILGLARPLLNPDTSLTGSGPLVIVVDNGWAAARDWAVRQATMDRLIDLAAREERPVVIAPTAPTATTAQASTNDTFEIMSAGDARTLARGLQPQPWPVDRASAVNAVTAMDLPGSANVHWLSDGLSEAGDDALAEALQQLGGLTVHQPDSGAMPILLSSQPNLSGELTVRVQRPSTSSLTIVTLQALGQDGRILGQQEVPFEPGALSSTVDVELPLELRNDVGRIVVLGQGTAGATLLGDAGLRRRPVGIATQTLDENQPLLSPNFFVDQAVNPFGEVKKGAVSELVRSGIAVIALPDSYPLTPEDRGILNSWVNDGGMLVRFAGPTIARGEPDNLLPVALRGGDRIIGGALSWSDPATLATFETASPFAGLEIPEDVQVQRQVLAEPSLELAAKTWARLSDGTPIVTGERRESGWVVLVHTTATTEWSNLAISGLFVEMMQRLVRLSQGLVGGDDDGMLAPVQTLDAFGRLSDPADGAVAVSGRNFSETEVGPDHPPGYYGSDAARRAFNLGDALTRATARSGSDQSIASLTDIPLGAATESYGRSEEVEFAPWALTLALVLLLIDSIVGLALRGHISLALNARTYRQRAAKAAETIALVGALSGIVMLALTTTAEAQTSQRVTNGDDFALRATLETRLAYVITGVPRIDDTSHAGLSGLSRLLNRRTSIEAGEPMGVNLDEDELAFFPLLYWPLDASQQALSAEVADKLTSFLATGGTILFDTRDQGRMTPGTLLGGGGPGSEALRRVAQSISIPALAPVGPDHVLTKAFYLLTEFPGRYGRGTLWIEQTTDQTANDGVASVLIGGNDWAGAWAVDGAGNPLNSVSPGGEEQREIANRFGVNLVMYALTGNYKSDQVHVPAILERLGQ